MLRIAIGPERPLASWNWVGFDLVRELAKYHHVEAFRETIPACDVVVAIKALPPQLFDRAGPKVVYCPIDQYASPAEIVRDAPLLRRCAAVCVHAAPLAPYFKPYCPNVVFVEHHLRYSLSEPSAYKEHGDILWIGAFENVPYLLKWCERHPMSEPLTILSNILDARSVRRGEAVAERIGVRLRFARSELNGFRTFHWSERGQMKLMRGAKAGVDIKGGDWLGPDEWHQRMKPPTKAQQFIGSGIPFACNQDSYSHGYFKVRGFDVASPLEVGRWLSQEYWEQTCLIAIRLRENLSLESLGRRFEGIITRLCLKTQKRCL